MKKLRFGDHKEVVKSIERIFIVTCCLFFVFTKFYKLAEIPYGIHVDEAAMGYDAWSLANFGVDRWRNYLPVYLVNFGGGQSALYAYLCAILIKLTGGDVSLFLMRLPGAIISLIAYISALVLLYKAIGKRWMMAGAFLLAIVPYFMMQSRFGLDCNLLVNMITISVLLLQLALEKKKTIFFILAGCLWGLTYYAYALSYVANTIIILVTVVYLLWTKRTLWKKLLAFLIPVCLLGLPLALVVLINEFEFPQINLPFLTIIRIPEYRGGEFSFTLEKTMDNAKVILESLLLRDWLDYNAFSGYYTMYRISIPFIIVGFGLLTIHCFRLMTKREYHVEQIWWLIFVVYFVVSLGITGPNINKVNGMFFSLFIFLVWGIRGTFSLVQRYHKKIACVLMCVLFLIYSKNAYSFTNFYFQMYPDYVYPQFLFLDTYEGILDHLEETGMNQKTVYVDSLYVYHGLSTKTSPYDIDIRQNGESIYQNYIFYIPGEFEQGAVYIVRETSYDYREMIEQYLEPQYSDGMYICYY